MNHTIFDTPVIRTVLRWTSIILLKCQGWKVYKTIPTHKKYVMIAAPHTSNWDFYFTMLVALSLKVKIYWMGKDTLFRGPMNVICSWLGGIPINRRKSQNVVGQSVSAFNRADKLVMVVPPEGTRSKTRYWKTGFYHIAHGAGVPIALGFMDFRLKMGGIGPLLFPTGDIDEDMKLIKSFYANVSGKHLDQTSDVTLIDSNFVPVDFSPVLDTATMALRTSGDSEADRTMLQSLYATMTGQADSQA